MDATHGVKGEKSENGPGTIWEFIRRLCKRSTRAADRETRGVTPLPFGTLNESPLPPLLGFGTQRLLTRSL